MTASKPHKAEGTVRVTVDLPAVLSVPLQQLADKLGIPSAEAVRVILAKMFSQPWMPYRQRMEQRVKLDGTPMTPCHENDFRGIP